MTKTFLHVGCGLKKKDATTKVFNSDAWEEVRLDINALNDPDIVSSMQNMTSVEDNSFDAVYSSHNIEHLYAYEVIDTLNEFKRVLKDDGFLILTCPDIKPICEAIANGKVNQVLYDSKSGPIYPLDVLYGFQKSIAGGDHFMAHKFGFTPETLELVIKESNFKSFCVGQSKKTISLWLIAYNNIEVNPETLFNELQQHV